MTFFLHNVHYIMFYAFPRDYSTPKYVYMNTRTAAMRLYRIYKTVVIINKRESNQTNSRLMDFYNNDHYL